jgi:hypothetical protein
MTGKFERYRGTGMPRRPQPSPWASFAVVVVMLAIIVLAWCGKAPLP